MNLENSLQENGKILNSVLDSIKNTHYPSMRCTGVISTVDDIPYVDYFDFEGVDIVHKIN